MPRRGLNGTRTKFLPWLSRAPKQHEKRDSLEVQVDGLNLGAIWNFLDGGVHNNESGEPVNDLTALSISTGFTACRAASL
jgi:hypothetical protein